MYTLLSTTDTYLAEGIVVANCRCEAIPLPGSVAESLQLDPAVPVGTTVTAQVWTAYERAGESEAEQVGGGWLLGGARDVAAAHRG